MGIRSACAVAAVPLVACTLGLPAVAQHAPVGNSPAAQTAVNLSPPLLPNGFANWKSVSSPGAQVPNLVPNTFMEQRAPENSPPPPEPSFSLANANKAALEECGPQRSFVQNYASGGRTLHVEAVQFKDATGALAAFSMLEQPGMREVKDLGSRAAAGDDGVLFIAGASVAVAFPATTADLPALKSLAEVMPQPVGSQALQPLLPTLLPARGLQPASVRYAVGPQDYMAEGGVLPAAGLGWAQSAEAVTGKYSDRRGTETLTLLFYPTPPIAGTHLRAIEAQLPGLGASFRNAKTRREGSLIMVANGSFSAAAAQALVENTHLRQIASTDKAMVTPDVVETRKTFGLLANVIIFSGVLGLAALIFALFFGGGRALIRILQGKPAATEAEFLSLHLDPQNAAPQFSTAKPGENL